MLAAYNMYNELNNKQYQNSVLFQKGNKSICLFVTWRVLYENGWYQSNDTISLSSLYWPMPAIRQAVLIKVFTNYTDRQTVPLGMEQHFLDISENKMGEKGQHLRWSKMQWTRLCKFLLPVMTLTVICITDCLRVGINGYPFIDRIDS